MAEKKMYPGGFRLTLKTARALAIQEFGMAKGLGADKETYAEGSYRMQIGNLCICIRPDIRMSGCIEMTMGTISANHRCVGYFNRETLEPDFNVMTKYERQERREELEQWVYSCGPETCHKRIDEIWDKQ